MLQNWLKVFWYNCRKNKFFTLLTIMGLAIGFAISLLAISFWTTEQSINQWNPKKDEVYQIVRIPESKSYYSAYQPNIFSYYLKEQGLIADYCYMDGYYSQESLKTENKIVSSKKSFRTQNNFFEYFPFEKISGSYEGFKTTKNAIALEESLAVALFGDQFNGVDQLITDSYGQSWTVKLVYKLNEQSSVKPEIINTYWSNQFNTSEDAWYNFGTASLIKLKPSVSRQVLQKAMHKEYQDRLIVASARMQNLSLSAYLEKKGDVSFEVEPLSEIYQKSKATLFPEGLSNHLFLNLNIGFAALIFVLSLINFINLSGTQALKRGKEMGLRRVLGSNIWNFYLQYLFETAIIFFVAFLLALVSVEWLSPIYNQLFSFEIQIGFKAMLILFSMIIFMVLFISALPALFLSSTHLQNMLRGQFGSSKLGIFIRNCSLVIQFSIATFFILVSFNANKQIAYLVGKNLGFSGEQVIRLDYKVNLKGNPFIYFKSFEQDLKKIKGVQSVAISNFSFIDGNSVFTTSLYHKENHSQVINAGIDENYLDLLNIPIIEGRGFDSRFASDSIHGILLNETAIKELRIEDPVNKRIKWMGKECQILGVVKDFNTFNLEQEPDPILFANLNGNTELNQGVSSIYLKMDPSFLEESIPMLEAFWKKRVDEYFPFEYEFVDKAFAKTYRHYTLQSNLFNILNAIVIFISLLGLFALVSFTIERKFKEIAIRKVLGAEVPSLLQNLSKIYLILFLLGFSITLVPSYYLIQTWLNNFAYRIEISWISYAIAFLSLFTLMVGIVLSKAYKATKINTLTYLKHE